MGNEQAIPNDRSSIQSVRNQEIKRSSIHNFSLELLIVVRGQRATGKTTLINLMQGQPFSNQYAPTGHLEAADIPFRADFIKDDIVRIKVWDVVERAIPPHDAWEISDYADATTVDTLKNADGLVIMIDQRYSDTISLAVDIIKNADEELPILIFNNFMDDENNSPVLPDPLKEYIGKFYYTPGSLRYNQGLVELSKWLKLPYLYSKKKSYYNLYKSFNNDLLENLKQFGSYASNFLTHESALQFAPKIHFLPSDIGNEKQQQNDGIKTEGNIVGTPPSNTNNDPYTDNSAYAPGIKINDSELSRAKREEIPIRRQRVHIRRQQQVKIVPSKKETLDKQTKEGLAKDDLNTEKGKENNVANGIKKEAKTNISNNDNNNDNFWSDDTNDDNNQPEDIQGDLFDELYEPRHNPQVITKLKSKEGNYQTSVGVETSTPDPESENSHKNIIENKSNDPDTQEVLHNCQSKNDLITDNENVLDCTEHQNEFGNITENEKVINGNENINGLDKNFEDQNVSDNAEPNNDLGQSMENDDAVHNENDTDGEGYLGSPPPLIYIDKTEDNDNNESFWDDEGVEDDEPKEIKKLSSIKIDAPFMSGSLTLKSLSEDHENSKNTNEYRVEQTTDETTISMNKSSYDGVNIAAKSQSEENNDEEKLDNRPARHKVKLRMNTRK